MYSNVLFHPTNSITPQKIQFTMIENKEKQQIFTREGEMINVWHSCLKKIVTELSTTYVSTTIMKILQGFRFYRITCSYCHCDTEKTQKVNILFFKSTHI